MPLIFDAGSSNVEVAIVAKNTNLILFLIYALGILLCFLQLNIGMLYNNLVLYDIGMLYDNSSKISDATPELHAITGCDNTLNKCNAEKFGIF